ncbi:hypothetical protein GGTG_09272 [Gaeumannomyces tritici R3-111a-1]|uniref:Uncharacterized protein n=1 Tax=Gaeumannomyces tritici (strain R3-111a-1) TaxID=644352 RepID=J3P6X6_GAET3|nr:hypothetical protein GGTG_09272 [Gaeumannomyces tritici R3-111a-1]EJT72406.1 hypothetical protein GGTG_09272 [Gaeumannomyces tritici R3-111a-1]
MHPDPSAVALSGNKSSLWFAKEHLPKYRRVKALMKQIVGSPFWGEAEAPQVRAAAVGRAATAAWWSSTTTALSSPASTARSRPGGHLYEHAMLHNCTLADWADLAPANQVAAYVALRNARAVDVDGVIDKAARKGGKRRAQRPGGRGQNNGQNPGRLGVLDPGAAAAQTTGNDGAGQEGEVYKAGDVVWEGFNGSKAQFYCEREGMRDCVCNAAGYCNVNAGADYIAAGKAFSANGFVPADTGNGEGNGGDGGGGRGSGNGSGGGCGGGVVFGTGNGGGGSGCGN